MRLKIRLSIFLCFCMGFSSVSSAKSCLEIFSKNFSSSFYDQEKTLRDTTEGFIAYFELLLEKQVIGERELQGLITSLKLGRLTNPISADKAELESELYEHFKGFQEYIEREDLDLDQILKWGLERSKEKKEESEERSKVKKETKERIYQEMEWGLVPAGDFKMGEEGEKVPVTLSHSFKAMTTPVTQRMWVEVMGENPSYFSNGEHSIVVEVNGELVPMQPDHPVENLTFYSMLVFINRLSKRDGLKPAYDLSGIKWKPGTRAEDGTLYLKSGEVKINVPNGNYYETEGYRLPTEAEQEYLLRAAGTANGKYYFGSDEVGLSDHAWFAENSEGKTHPVGELKGLIIQGSAFYDLMGNVGESGWDYHSDLLQGGRDPVGPGREGADGRISRGGSWSGFASCLDSGKRAEWSPGIAFSGLGFRVVKTVRP